MMKLTYFTLALAGLLFTLPAWGQCPTGNVTLSSQSQIDAFPAGCTTILGNLTISESSAGDIIDLSPLAELTSVQGRLLVFDNTGLTSLTGLNNITSTTQSTRISKNGSLSDLSGLGGLMSVSSFLQIDNNAGLTSVDGLNASLQVDGRLIVEDNDELLELDGMNGITQIGNATLEISDNPKLADISGLNSLDPLTIINLIIEDNPMLGVCEVLVVCDYLAVPTNTASISGNATGCISRAEVENACTPLPVEFLEFTVERSGKGSILSWSVVAEGANFGYYVQRSTGNTAWKDLDFVPSASATLYTYQDKNPGMGDHFYRIRQEDNDGITTYSPIRSITFAGGESELSVFPNPASDEVFVAGLDEQTTFRVRLRDLNGRTLSTTMNNNRLALDGTAPGTYLLEIVHDGETTCKRLVVGK